MMKTMVAAICVAAASMGGMKAFDAANSSRANMLLMENVEALSAGAEAEAGNGYEKKSESACPIPFDYKKSRTCQQTIKNTSCTESECY